MHRLHATYGRTSRPSRNFGFTLVELLVVVAVTSVLAGLMLPGLGRAKSQGRCMVCNNNLRQIGLANWMYFSDEGKPVHYNFLPYLWMLTLQKNYSAIDKVRICPVAPERSPAELKQRLSNCGSVTRAWATGPLTTITPIFQGSYALNGYFYTDSPYGDPTNFFKVEADVCEPARTPFFVDSLWVDAWPRITDRAATNLFEGDRPLLGGLQRIALPRHAFPAAAAPRNFDLKNTLPGAVNVAFCDTHVETVKLEQLWSLSWHKNWQPTRRPGLR